MHRISSLVLAGVLLAIPTTTHAQSDTPPQIGGATKHAHPAPSARTAADQSEATRPPMMDMAKHMEGCCCPCCKMMQQHGEKAKSPELGSRKPGSEEHQH